MNSHHRSFRRLLAHATLLSGVICVFAAKTSSTLAADEVHTWKDTNITRIEALALLETLNSQLLSNDSATLTLDQWCELHQMASPAKIVAERIHGVSKEASDETRGLLGVGGSDVLAYRRVRLHCGAHVLSEADNWYVPGKLTPEMNEVLNTSDIPFGRAVQALHFHRRTLSAKILWNPLPQGWEMQARWAPTGKGPLKIPAETIQHRAVLALPDGTPFSLVVETYTNEVLSFPQPPTP